MFLPFTIVSNPWRRWIYDLVFRCFMNVENTPLFGARKSESTKRTIAISTIIGPVGSDGAEADRTAPIYPDKPPKMPAITTTLSVRLLQNRAVTAGIINLRATTFQLQNAVINNSELIDNSILVAFEKEVLNMISNMFDPQETFEHLNKEGPCYFCD